MVAFSLAIPQPLAPMEATLVSEIPATPRGESPLWQYEPKWDGFRSIAFRDGDTITLQSKAQLDLTRYFPDVAEEFASLGARRFALDGEIVIPSPAQGGLSFDDLLQRIHPAASRVERLANEHPAAFIAFDLIADERGRSLLDLPLRRRRERLERFAARYFPTRSSTDQSRPARLPRPPAIRLSPASTKLSDARKWFEAGGAGLDGIMAKRLDLPYQSGDRTGMQKVKHMRTCDCVVGGFRYAQKEKIVGSLLLGLFDDEGLLHHIGFSSNLPREERAALTPRLEKLIAKGNTKDAGFTGSAPGGPSRWSRGRSTDWHPLKHRLIVEVQYDHYSQNRFRHGATFLRWRPDKAPAQCTFEQIRPVGPSPLRYLR